MQGLAARLASGCLCAARPLPAGSRLAGWPLSALTCRASGTETASVTATHCLPAVSPRLSPRDSAASRRRGARSAPASPPPAAWRAGGGADHIARALFARYPQALTACGCGGVAGKPATGPEALSHGPQWPCHWQN